MVAENRRQSRHCKSSRNQIPGPVPRGFGRKIVAHRTPDQGWAWVIALSCCTINAIIFGIYRTYGVLYVSLLRTYGVSRETAAWPFSLCLTVFHMTGLLSGALSSYFSSRSISVCGCLIAAFGFAACFLATSVLQVSILIGVVIGFGYGLIGTQTPVIINQYFSKYRATASGFALAGGTIGSFLFPPLVKLILSEYNLHGCFLILAGFVLNTVPIAMLLRPPIPSSTPRQDSLDTNDDPERQAEKKMIEADFGDVHMGHVDLKSTKNKRYNLGPPKTFEMTRALIIAGRQKEEQLTESAITSLLNQNRLLSTVDSNNRLNSSKQLLELPQCTCDGCSTTTISTGVGAIDLSWSSPQGQVQPHGLVQKFLVALRSNLLIISRVLRNPLFIILCSTQISFTWGWTTYSMVIVDFSVDRGVDFFSAVTLLSAFSGADLIGRLGSGWISDKGIIKRRNVAFASILSIGLLLWMLPIASSFPVLLANAFALGLFSGSLMILFSILLVEYVGIETMPVALGTSTFCCGVATLFRPIVIGYFRDIQGSYDGLFQFLGVVCIMVAVLWLVEPCAALWQERRDRQEKEWQKTVTPLTTEKGDIEKQRPLIGLDKEPLAAVPVRRSEA